MPPKSTHSGPLAAVTKAELYHLRDEVELYQEVKQTEIDNAVDIWFKVYHCLDFLVAAQTGPGLRTLNALDAQRQFIKKPDSYLVPAFYLEEAGEDGKSGWIFKDIAAEFATKKDSTTIGLNFTAYLAQKVEDEDTPVLELFLKEALVHALPPNFSPMHCYQICVASVDQKPDQPYFKMALDLIEQLWEPVKSQLNENKIGAWLAEIPSDNLEEWLKSKLDITTPFLISLDELFYSEDKSDKRKEINKLVAALYINAKTYNRIYHRLSTRKARKQVTG